MKRLILALCALIGAAAFSGALDLAAGVVDTTLPNGLRVVLKPVPEVPLVHVRIAYQVGFQDSPEGAFELPHFLEHLLFRETADLAEGEIVRLVAETGGWQNGYTSLEETVYLQTVPSGHLETVVALEASRMARAVFKPGAFEREVEIVGSEIRNLKSSPSLNFNRNVSQRLGLPYAPFFDPDRREAELKTFTLAQVEAFYRAYYRPERATLYLVGDFEPQAVLAAVRRHFGPLQGQGPAGPRTRPAPVRLETAGVLNDRGVVQQPFGARWYNAFPRERESRRQLIWDFITRSGLIPELSLVQGDHFGYLMQEYNEIAPPPLEVLDFAILAERFTEVKERFLAGFSAGYDDLDALADSLAGTVWLYGNAGAEARRLAAWRTLQFAEVEAEIRRLLDTSLTLTTHFAVSRYSAQAQPGSGPTAIAKDDFSANVDYSFLSGNDPALIEQYRRRLAETAPVTDRRLRERYGAWTQRRLPNGVEVYYQQVALSDKTRLTLLFRNGSLNEDQPFVAAYTGDLVQDGGPQVLKRNQLETRGGGWQTVAGSPDLQFQTLVGRSAEAGMMSQILRETYSGRRFNPWVLDARMEREQVSWDLREQNQNPNFWSWDVVWPSLLAEDHPELRRRQATAAQRQDVTLAEVEAYYRRWVRPDQARLYVTSNQSLDALWPDLQAGVGAWTGPEATQDGAEGGETPASESTRASLARPGLRAPRGEVFVHSLPTSPENVVRLFAPITVELSPADKAALELGYAILGGGMDGRLFRELRGRQGLGYTVAAYLSTVGSLETYTHGGYLLVRGDKVDDALSAFKTEIRRFIDEGPSELELLYAKNKLVSGLAFQFKGMDPLHNALIGLVESGHWGDRQETVARILALTADQVREVFQRTLDPASYQIGVAGTYRRR